MKIQLKACYLVCCVIIAAIAFFAFTANNDIVLLDEQLPFKPNGFYIDTVTDKRDQKVSFALIALHTKGAKPLLQKADLKGGVAMSIGDFLKRNLEKDVSAIPVSIGVNNIKLTETVLPNGSIDGRINLGLSFGRIKDYGIQELVIYNGALQYIRPPQNAAVIEKQLRSIIKSGLIYFNNWMAVSFKADPKLARAVKFSFADYVDKQEGDTIYYAIGRPLIWPDFQSKTRPDGPFDAYVMPGFGYDIRESMEEGVINVHLTLKTYLAKSDSWVGGVRSAYALNHEQRHFDIARIITRRYQKKILNAGLTPDTYQAFISMQYLDSYRDMNVIQRTYDKETRHGADTYGQNLWNKKIDEMLNE